MQDIRSLSTTPYYIAPQIAENRRDWSVLSAITGMKLPDQIRWLQGVLLEAAHHNDDKAAQVFAEYMIHAIDDSELVPFIKLGWKRQPFVEQSERVVGAKRRVFHRRAVIMRSLWDELPSRKIVAVTLSVQDLEGPLLPETRKVILTEIALWWKETEDEGEADAYFQFLLSTRRREDHEREKEALRAAIREAAKPGFPPARLVQALRRAVAAGDVEIGNILAVAWARNSSPKAAADHLSATLSLTGASPAAFDFLAAVASRVKEVDAAVTRLTMQMKMSGEHWSEWNQAGLKEVPGQIEVRIASFTEITVKIVIRTVHGFQENYGRDTFEDAKRHIHFWWKKIKQGYRVNLQIEVTAGHHHGRVAWRHEQEVVDQ